MGASGAGIIIRTKNVEDIDIKKLLESVIGKETEKGGFCDLRNEGCFYLGKTKNSISILNSDLAERFFTAKDTSEIQDILTKLPENDLIYAFEEYDSGGTYSYATIRNNKFDRRFRSLTYETTIDEGELEEREVAWNNSKKEKDDLGDGEWEWLYTHPDRDDFKCPESSLPKIKLQDIMINLFNLTTETMGDLHIEDGHFQVSEQIKTEPLIKSEEKTEIIKKSWWKVW